MEKGGGVGKIRGTRFSVLVTLTLSYFFLPRLSVRELWVLRLCEIHREEPILPHRVILILHLKESTLSGLLKSYRIWGLAAPSQSVFTLPSRRPTFFLLLLLLRTPLCTTTVSNNAAYNKEFRERALFYSHFSLVFPRCRRCSVKRF